MSDYTVSWVGDKTREWGTQRGYSLAVRDEAGVEHRKVKLDRPQSSPAPQVGEVISGDLRPHAKFDDAEQLHEGNAPILSATAAAPGGDRQESIQRQTSVKASAGIVEALISAGRIKNDDEAVAAISSYAEVIFGWITERNKAVAEAQQQAKAEADDGGEIPF